MLADEVGRTAQGVGVEVGVARGGRRLRVPQQLADDGQAEAGTGADRGEGVPQVVQPDALQSGVTLDGLPWLLQA